MAKFVFLRLCFIWMGFFHVLALFFPLVNAHIHKNTNIRMIRSNMHTCHIFSQLVLSTACDSVENHAGKTKTKAHGFHTASMSSRPTLWCNDRMQRNYSSRIAVGILFCRTFALPPNIYMLSSGEGTHLLFCLCYSRNMLFKFNFSDVTSTDCASLPTFLQKCFHTQSVQPSFNSIDACCSISLYI